MKCDDDSFVRLEMLISSILDYYSLNSKCSHSGPKGQCQWNPRPFLMGKITHFRNALAPFGGSEARFNMSTKLTLSESVNGFKPRCPQGVGYVLSRPLASAIVTSIDSGHLRFLQAEDQSIGVWVHHLVQLRHFRCGIDYISKFGNLIQYKKTKPCHKRYMMLHYISPNRMTCLWRKLDRVIGSQINTRRDFRQYNYSFSQTFNLFADWCC
jgi:hypothetical protein